MEVNFKKILAAGLKKFNSMEKRQRRLMTILVTVILCSLFYTNIFAPRAVELKKLKMQNVNTANRLINLKSQIPNIQKERTLLTKSKKDLDSLQKQLSELESKLPRQGRTPQLLGEFVRQAQGYDIDFISIRPQNVDTEKTYNELGIELVFTCTYQVLVNYLHRLESLSEYLDITSINTNELEATSYDISEVTLTLRMLLGDEGTNITKENIVSVIEPRLDVNRNPFQSKFRPDRTEREIGKYKLTGITASGKVPTAIINDDVYRIGDTIIDKKVKKILPNCVILTDGSIELLLTVDENR